MPIWSPIPPPQDRAVPYRIVRVPASGDLKGIVTTPDIVGCNTHYVGHRTIPCEGPDACKACAEGHSWRWHAYVGLLLTTTLEHTILELTAAASDPLRTYYDLHNTVRACRITAKRPSGRLNGRIVLACQATDELRVRLPAPPNIQKILSHLWGIKYDAPEKAILARPPAVQMYVTPGEDDARYKL